LDQTSIPRSPCSTFPKKYKICVRIGWSSPIRSRSASFSSGVARGPSASEAGSPGTRKTMPYMATMTTIRIRIESPNRRIA
jgi:hypothetical protein